MQNLVTGKTYEGVLTVGPCKGTCVNVTYLGESGHPYGAGVSRFRVNRDTFFGIDEEYPGDDGWWRTGEIIHLGTGCYDWSEDVGVQENE